MDKRKKRIHGLNIYSDHYLRPDYVLYTENMSDKSSTARKKKKKNESQKSINLKDFFFLSCYWPVTIQLLYKT